MSGLNHNVKIWAGGFLYDPIGHRVLLHLRDGNTKFNPNKWAMFGGLCTAGETPARCFIRELNEEIGLLAALDELVLLRSHLYKKLNTHRNVYFIRRAVNISCLTLGEGAGFKWFPLSRVDKYDLTELTRKDLNCFITQAQREHKRRSVA